MNLLLDTHTLIWFLEGNDKLSAKVLQIIENTENGKFVSIASLWELAIKININKIDLKLNLHDFINELVNYGIQILPISVNHILEISRLELIHRDPFDRILIAQSITENFAFTTKDENIIKYNIQTIW